MSYFDDENDNETEQAAREVRNGCLIMAALGLIFVGLMFYLFW